MAADLQQVDEEEKANDANDEQNETKDFLNADIIDKKWSASFKSSKGAVVFPVIHVSNPGDTDKCMKLIKSNIALVQKFKFDGCFVINHGFRPMALVPIIKAIKKQYPKLWLGANFLGCIGDEFEFMHKTGVLSFLDGLWVDNAGIYYSASSNNVSDTGAMHRLKKYQKHVANNSNFLYFGGVDFKYTAAQLRKNDFDDVQQYVDKCKGLAQHVSRKGFMDCVCTTGKGTGKAADLDKMKAFREGCNVNGSRLSIASGVTPENVTNYLPFVDAILVATGISGHWHQLSEVKMRQMRKAIDAFYSAHKKL